MSDPLSAIDTLVHDAIRNFAGVTAIVPASRIQVWDRRVDVRGEVERASDTGDRIWIVPAQSQTDLNWASGTARFERRYRIQFGIGHLMLSELRAIEWQVTRACTLLKNLKQPDGVTPIVQPAPIQIEAIGLTESDPEREPLDDPEEWTDICDIVVLGFVPRAAIISG